MSEQISIIRVPIGQNTSSLECSDCGPMGLYPHEDTDKVIYAHLTVDHQCEPTFDIHDVEIPGREES